MLEDFVRNVASLIQGKIKSALGLEDAKIYGNVYKLLTPTVEYLWCFTTEPPPLKTDGSWMINVPNMLSSFSVSL